MHDGGDKSKEVHSYFNKLIAAGVPRYLEKSKSHQLLPPSDFKASQIEQRIQGAWRHEDIQPRLYCSYDDGLPDDKSVEAIENHKVVSHEQQNRELREQQMKLLSKE